ncbi:MAG: ferritin-like domain-containing protein, partial [Cyanobacteria bacterium P01_A01_bin.17]
ALQRIYIQLTGLKLRPIPHEPRPYQPSGDIYSDLYIHGLHRVATEYGATCLYLWLMAHSTGPLQAILAELLRDEINHMTKFWGFGLWAYPDASALTIVKTLVGAAIGKLFRRQHAQASLIHTLRRMAQVLHWSAWSWGNKLTFMWTFLVVLLRLWRWSSSLTPAYLKSLLGCPEHKH